MFMELLDIMNERFSVRKYVDKPVEPEKLDKILNAAHAAPTAANQQPVKLLVVLSPESLEKLGKAANIYGVPTKQKHGNVLLTECRQPILTHPF